MRRTFTALRNLIVLILLLPSLYATAQNCCNAEFNFQNSNNTFHFFADDPNNANILRWDMGDGTQRFEESPVHTYTSPGNYAVTFTKESVSIDPITQDSIRRSCAVTRYIRIDSIQACNANFAYQQSRRGVYFYPYEYDYSNPTQSFWTFGDGGSSSELYPYHIYDTAGVYTVCHIRGGMRSYNFLDTTAPCETCMEITVLDPIRNDTCNAAFQYTTNGNTAAFSFRNLLDNESEYWTFGDGEDALSSNPMHTYSTSGTYTVYHYVFSYTFDSLNSYYDSDTCVDIQTLVIQGTINRDTCNANFNSSVYRYTASFSSYADDNDDQFWLFGDGQSSTQSSPSHTYSGAGTYIVQHTVVTRDSINQTTGDTCSSQYVITISDPYRTDTCFANFGHTIVEKNVSFYSYSADALDEHIWQFGDGTVSFIADPLHTFSSAGTYTISHTVINRNDIDTSIVDTCYEQQVITISDPVTRDSCNADFNYSRQGNAVVFYSINVDANDYQQWEFGDGGFSTSAYPVHHYNSLGTFIVTHTVMKRESNQGAYYDTCFVQYEITIPDSTLQDSCNADFTYDVAGRIVAFASHGTNANDYQIWEFGDGQISTESSPTHTYMSAGTYIVSHEVLNGNESGSGYPYTDTCRVQYTITIAADSNHVDSCNASFFYTMVGNSIELHSYVSDGNDEVLWDFGDGTVSTEHMPHHTYASAGNYLISHIVRLYYENNGGFMYSDTCIALQVVTITDPNTDTCRAGFTWSFRNDTLIVHADFQDAAHSWNFGDNSHIVGNAYNMHSFSSNGVYNVCHTLIMNGDSCTSCEQINAPIIANSFESTVIRKPEVLPNPTNEALTVRSNQGDLKFYSLTDMLGNIVASEFDINAYSTTIDTSTIASGSYILTVSDASGNISRHNIIVQH